MDDSGHNVGFEIEESGAITGYIKTGATTTDDDKWLVKAPDGYILTLDVDADKTLRVLGNLTVTDNNNSTAYINQDLRHDSNNVSFGRATIGSLSLAPAAGASTLTTTGGNLILDASTNILQLDVPTVTLATQPTSILLKDNEIASLEFLEDTNKYLTFRTVDNDEQVIAQKPLSVNALLSAKAGIETSVITVTSSGSFGSGDNSETAGLSSYGHMRVEGSYLEITGQQGTHSLKATGGASFGNHSSDEMDFNTGNWNFARTMFWNLDASDNDNRGLVFRKTGVSSPILVIDSDNIRIGVNTAVPDYELDVAGDIGIGIDGGANYIYHNGDSDTFIKFAADDINIQAGGVDFIKITEAAQDEIRFNDGGVDVDFVVETENTADAFTINGQAAGSATFKVPVNVGVDGTGHDVKVFGATTGQYLLWDTSADELLLAGDSKLSFHDAAGGENIIATGDGHLEVNAGTTLDATAPTIDLNGATEVNVDCGIFDVNATGVIDLGGASTITLDATTDIILDAAGADIIYKHSGTESGRFTQNGATSLTLDVVGDLILDADGGNITFKDGGTHGLDIANSAGNWIFRPLTTDKDIIFNEDGGAEIARFDSSEVALLMSVDKKILFRNNTEYIHSGAVGHLDHGATTEIHLTAPTVNIDASTETNISNHLVVGGNLTVNGTTTTVNSTTVTVDDPIITLGGDSAPASDDSKDRGVEFRYYSGSAKVGFFGFDTTNDRFTFLTDATNTSEVFSGTLGNIEVGGGYIGNIRVGVTSDNEVDTSAGNLTLDSAGGTVTVDDILVVTGESHITGNVGIANTDADEALHVTGNARVTGSLSAQGGGYNYLANRVGIGTLFPTDILTVAGSISGSDMLTTKHANVSGNFRGTGFANVSGNAGIAGDLAVEGTTALNGRAIFGNASSDNITINSGTVTVNNTLNFDSDTFVIDPSVNLIGIGTPSPSSKVHIINSDNKYGQLRLGYDTTNFSILSTDSAGNLHIKPTTGQSASFREHNVLLRKIVSENSDDVTIQTGGTSGNGFIVNNGNTNTMVVDGEYGDTGIGMSPVLQNAQLSIAKNAGNDNLRLYHNNNNYARFTVQDYIANYNGGLKIETHIDGRASGGDPYSTNKTGAVYISGGRVGIGVQDPDHSLEISGGLHFGPLDADPPAPANGDGGVLYTLNTGDLYYRSNTSQAGINISNTGLNKNGNVAETGLTLVAGQFTAVANAGGWADQNGSIDAIGSGTLVVGRTYNFSSAQIKAFEFGDWAGGFSVGDSCSIYASGGDSSDPGDKKGGSFAFGQARQDGIIKTHRPGSFAMGYAYGSGTGQYKITGALSACGAGSFATGKANLGRIMTKADGSFAHGYAGAGFGSSAADYEAFLRTDGRGSFALGIAENAYGSQSDTSYPAKLHAKGVGSFAMGSAKVGTPNFDNNWYFNKEAHVYTHADATGGFAMGYAYGGASHGKITARRAGTFAMGYAKNGFIEAGGAGSIAGGHVLGTAGAGSQNFKIVSTQTGIGGIAWGYAKDANIETKDFGSVALGFAKGREISAGGKGSFAMGYAVNNQIQADGDNSFQFGEGTNGIDDSFAVGSNFRFRHLTHVNHPSTSLLRDGDFWMKGTSVYLRTGGSNVQIGTAALNRFDAMMNGEVYGSRL